MTRMEMSPDLVSRHRLSRAVVLARGTGTRMRADDQQAALTPAQQQAASLGHKALMPVDGKPFLHYVLQPLAAAGVTDIALVVAPDHREMRAAFSDDRGPAGLNLSWIVQQDPRGTADAVLAAEEWAGDAPFLVMNGDNVYPRAALRALADLDGPGVAGFECASLVASSNITADRLAAFALIDAGPDDSLTRIVEKPDAAELERMGSAALVSMNLWRFDTRIFGACRDVAESPRHERELPSAVMLARSRGVRFVVIRARGPVLDLSRRSDVADVARRLSATSERS